MKFFRIIAAALILAMASGPALAAVCATSCVAGASSMAVAEQDSSAMVGDMAADHCHQATPEPSKHQPGTEHKGCTMAGGCHFSQAVPLIMTAQIPAANFSNTALPHFSPSEVCADLPPPIKPPA